MYPIKICRIRDRDGLQFFWQDEGLLGDMPAFALEAWQLAQLVADIIWKRDPVVARSCARDPGQIRNLLEFRSLSEIRRFNGVDYPEVLRLTASEQKQFRALVQRALEEIGDKQKF